jgi:hypothetical protein
VTRYAFARVAIECIESSTILQCLHPAADAKGGRFEIQIPSDFVDCSVM